MKFAEKLQKLTDGKSKALIARVAGLSPTAINDYLRKGYLPRADKALELAKALNVPLEWLMDDVAEFPVQGRDKSSSLAGCSDRDLMLQVAERQRRLHIALLDAIDDLKNLDWPTIEKSLENWHTGDPMPAPIQAIKPLMLEFQRLDMEWRYRYNPNYFAMLEHGRMPETRREFSEFDEAETRHRSKLLQQMPGYNKAYDALGIWHLTDEPGSKQLADLMGLRKVMVADIGAGGKWGPTRSYDFDAPPSGLSPAPSPASSAARTPPSPFPSSSPTTPPGIHALPKSSSKHHRSAPKSAKRPAKKNPHK